MITTEKLKAFQEILKDTQLQLDELLRVRQQEKLFKNSDDYYLSLKCCKYCPQDYFNYRLFDCIIELKYNRRINKYYLYIDCLKYDFFRRIEFTEFLSKYKLIPDKVSDKIFYISQDYLFEDCVKIFTECCTIYSSFYFSQDKLFDWKIL